MVLGKKRPPWTVEVRRNGKERIVQTRKSGGVVMLGWLLDRFVTAIGWVGRLKPFRWIGRRQQQINKRELKRIFGLSDDDGDWL